MGYETQLLVGTTSDRLLNGNGTTYFMVYATFDMSKLGNSELLNLPWENKNPDENLFYFFAACGDGNTAITKDCYGKFPKPIPLADVIEALEQDVKTSDYRRSKWTLAALKSMAEETKNSEELSVLLWGH